MESLGVFAEGDQWECFSRLFSNEDQELDFTPHFLGHEGSFPFQHNEGFNFETPTTLFPNPEAGDEMGLNRFNQSFFHSLDSLSSNMHYLPQENNSGYSASSGIFTAILNPENYYFGGNSCHTPMSNDISTSVDVSMTGNTESNFGSFIPAFSDIGMEGAVCNTEYSGSGRMGFSDDSQPPKELQLKRMQDAAAEKSNTEDASESNPKKKPRLSKDKTKKSNARSKKGQKANSDLKVKDEDESNTGVDRQSSSSYNSSEDDNASQETNGAGEISDPKSSSALNLNGKTRANRGSATDPQSLYARKRRERINERLRVLQNLVPNGTKVDISTMLEEAVHYVKFLQLQIKLLSSDDMWMYAPIAYNGMDIGLDLHKMSPLL